MKEQKNYKMTLRTFSASARIANGELRLSMHS